MRKLSDDIVLSALITLLFCTLMLDIFALKDFGVDSIIAFVVSAVLLLLILLFLLRVTLLLLGKTKYVKPSPQKKLLMNVVSMGAFTAYFTYVLTVSPMEGFWSWFVGGLTIVSALTTLFFLVILIRNYLCSDKK
ncbi:MAG: hypothetical protein RSB23_02280 [Alistipes sp.]